MSQASLAEGVKKNRICLHGLCDLASSFVLCLQPFLLRINGVGHHR